MTKRLLPTPQGIRDYLETHGWRECHPMPPVGALFEFEKLSDDNQPITLFAPASAHYDDYALRVSDLLDTLTPVERRPREAVLADLLAENAPAATPNGNLPTVPETPIQPRA
ncbi:MAG: hypothetical protein U0792_22205 [Gemmataceae bacterium]